MQSDVMYATNMVRSKALHTKHVYISGCKIQCFADVFFLHYGENNEKSITVLLVQDIFNKFCYSTTIPEKTVSVPSLSKAWMKLLRAGLPHFSLVRVDRDVVMAKLRDTIFKPRMMLLQPHRSKNYLSTLVSLNIWFSN